MQQTKTKDFAYAKTEALKQVSDFENLTQNYLKIVVKKKKSLFYPHIALSYLTACLISL